LADPKKMKKKDPKLEKILDSAAKAADKKNGVKERVIPESTLKKDKKGKATKGTTDEALPKTPPAPKKGKKKAAAKKAAAKAAKAAAKPEKPAAKALSQKVEHPPVN